MANQQPSEAQLKELAAVQGRKLGLLLASLNVSKETLEAFLDILPEMSVEQLEQLTDILEARYLADKTSALDEKLKEEFLKIKQESDKAAAVNEERALNALKKIEEELGV